MTADDRPINISSASEEEIGRRLANFGATPFTLDGRRYESVESFYVGLKFLGAAERAAIAVLPARQAWELGKTSTLAETEYQGRRFTLGGPEHHALIERAIRAKLAAHPDLARDFAATHPRPIRHDTGQPERPGTFLPAAALVRILTKLRDEIVANGNTPR